MRWRLLAVCAALLCVSGCPDETASRVVLGGSIDEPALRAGLAPFATIRGAKPGDEVVVQGTVGKVCPAGCWFYLHSPDDLVYVDVLGDIVVPQEAAGRVALVKARVDGEGGSRILQAQRVLLPAGDEEP